jgi:hypothetical protein
MVGSSPDVHHEAVDPITRRRRRGFAALRVVEISLVVIGGATIGMAITAPASPGTPHRELYFMAWSTPRLFVGAGGLLLAIAGLLQLMSGPLKRRWNHDLRGWIK